MMLDANRRRASIALTWDLVASERGKILSAIVLAAFVLFVLFSPLAWTAGIRFGTIPAIVLVEVARLSTREKRPKYLCGSCGHALPGVPPVLLNPARFPPVCFSCDAILSEGVKNWMGGEEVPQPYPIPK